MSTRPQAAQDRIGAAAGTLVESDGTPLAGATVSFMLASDGSVGSATTGPDGSYRIDGLAAGDYRVWFNSADNRRGQYAYGTLDYDRASIVTIVGDQPTSVSDRMLPTGTISLTAIDAQTGAAVADFCVYAWNAGYDGGSCSDGTGTITLSRVPATGGHELEVYSADAHYLTTQLSNVTVVAGATTPIVVTLTPAATVETTPDDNESHPVI